MLGRQTGTNEGEKKLLEKPLTKKSLARFRKSVQSLRFHSIWNAVQPPLLKQERLQRSVDWLIELKAC